MLVINHKWILRRADGTLAGHEGQLVHEDGHGTGRLFKRHRVGSLVASTALYRR